MVAPRTDFFGFCATRYARIFGFCATRYARIFGFCATRHARIFWILRYTAMRFDWNDDSEEVFLIRANGLRVKQSKNRGCVSHERENRTWRPLTKLVASPPDLS